MPKLTALTCAQLKELLRINALNTQGNKTELVLRLQEHFGKDEMDEPTFNNYFPLSNSSLFEQMNSMRQMLETLAKTVTDLSMQTTQTTKATSPQDANAETNSIVPDNAEINEEIGVNEQDADHNRYSVREIAETILEFDPTKETSFAVEEFVQHIDGAKSAYEWGDKCLLLAVYSRLRGVARMWLDCRGTLFTNWYEFKTDILNEFGCSLDEAEIGIKMSKTTRRHDEQIIDYCFRIQAIGRRFNPSASAIIRYAREGIKHREIQSATAAMIFTSMNQFRETIDQYLSNMPAPSRQHFQHAIPKNSSSFKNSNQREATNVKPNVDREFRCYNCGK